MTTPPMAPMMIPIETLVSAVNALVSMSDIG